ncbi:hypothetical protein Pyn_08655 [Prunus yedoensis var. nudiflora]|uniref:Uncharacterized protein n=1 Tax=Prunus yedoensis var. nudiflora TaxID=2094558 RepID=A0A314YBE3_PRUYE|nr:hypothetical protein Pyn_08655 [Prunus yedoensis var. nudiflora]
MAAISRHLPFTTIFNASTTRGSPLLGDSYTVEVAFKVLMSLIAWIMVALFVALVACPPPFLSRALVTGPLWWVWALLIMLLLVMGGVAFPCSVFTAFCVHFAFLGFMSSSSFMM